MSSPEIIFYQGLRCTKVLRQPRATISDASASLQPSTTSQTSASNPEPTSLQETLPTEPSTSSTEPPTDTSSSTTTTPTSNPGSSTSHGHETSQSYSPGISISLSNSAGPVTRTTLVTESSTAVPTVTSPPLPTDDFGDGGPGSSLGAILGSLFGGLGFIALVFLICFLLFFCYRRRRRRPQRRSAGTWSFGGSERLLRDGRASADSTASFRQEYQSGMSFLSNASPARSIYNFIQGGANNTNQEPYRDQVSPRHSNPFSDSAEVSHGTESSIVPIMIRHSLANPSNGQEGSRLPGQPETSQQAQAPILFPFHYNVKRPESVHSAESGSIHGSEHSLGSTIILPGRSSTGSSLPRGSFPFPMPPNMEPSVPRGAATRDSTRSDPFDLDVPQFPVSRRSSGTIPIALL